MFDEAPILTPRSPLPQKFAPIFCGDLHTNEKGFLKPAKLDALKKDLDKKKGCRVSGTLFIFNGSRAIQTIDVNNMSSLQVHFTRAPFTQVTVSSDNDRLRGDCNVMKVRVGYDVLPENVSSSGHLEVDPLFVDQRFKNAYEDTLADSFLELTCFGGSDFYMMNNPRSGKEEDRMYMMTGIKEFAHMPNYLQKNDMPCSVFSLSHFQHYLRNTIRNKSDFENSSLLERIVEASMVVVSLLPRPNPTLNYQAGYTTTKMKLSGVECAPDLPLWLAFQPKVVEEAFQQRKFTLERDTTDYHTPNPLARQCRVCIKGDMTKKGGTKDICEICLNMCRRSLNRHFMNDDVYGKVIPCDPQPSLVIKERRKLFEQSLADVPFALFLDQRGFGTWKSDFHRFYLYLVYKSYTRENMKKDLSCKCNGATGQVGSCEQITFYIGPAFKDLRYCSFCRLLTVLFVVFETGAQPSLLARIQNGPSSSSSSSSTLHNDDRPFLMIEGHSPSPTLHDPLSPSTSQGNSNTPSPPVQVPSRDLLGEDDFQGSIEGNHSFPLKDHSLSPNQRFSFEKHYPSLSSSHVEVDNSLNPFPDNSLGLFEANFLFPSELVSIFDLENIPSEHLLAQSSL